ncbi:MAG TPA: c-type cytochrome [Pirellulaceae bacterium]|nr:c-type cytochrome [Pirellulaceae bacterium]
MRKAVIALLLIAGVTACDRKQESGEVAVSATPAQLTFDGADYKDEASKIAHGRRLAVVLDCTGCHGADMQGKNVTADDPSYGQMNAPNVTLLLAKYSDADFDRLIRHGVPKDAREFWFMPVESFQFLSDADLSAITAYLRSFKPAGTRLPPITKGKGFHEDVARGFLDAQSQVRRYRETQPVDIGPQHSKGRYLVKVICTACHNGQLEGYRDFTPDLDIAGAYSDAELTRLLSTGEGKVKKNLGMMSEMGRDHFSSLTPNERQTIVSYLKARAERPQ